MKRVLIVRLDAIGDYILFRNVFRFIRRSEKYRDSEITLFGNPAWRGIAEAYDSDCADNWIWADNRNELFRNSHENLLPDCIWHRRVCRAQSVWRDKLRGRFDEVLSLQAFRDPLLDEFVSGLAPVVVNGWELPQGDSPFVFYRNCFIASALTGENCSVPLELKVCNAAKSKGILFFTGGSHWTKRWPMRRWRELESLLPSGYSPLYAVTDGTLPDFIKVVSSVSAVVSNDTMAAHVAVALGVPCVTIANGTTGKDVFWPYPESLSKRQQTVSPKVRRLPQIIPKLVRERLELYLSIASIPAKTVAESVSKVLGEAYIQAKERHVAYNAMHGGL